MFKILFLLALFVVSLHAAPVQSPSQPALLERGFLIPDTSLVNVRLGFQADYLQKKRLHADTSSGECRKFRMDSLFEMGAVTLNVKEWFDGYVFLGQGITKIHFLEGKTSFLGKKSGQFLWMAGGKLIVFERKFLRFGVDVKALGISSPISFHAPSMPTHFSFFEWQISAGLSQTVSFFTPYFGITFCNASVKLKPFPLLDQSELKLRHKDLIGIFTGFVLTPGSYASFGFEARLVNETAYTVYVDARF